MGDKILVPKKEIMDKMMAERTKAFASCFYALDPLFPNAKFLSEDEILKIARKLALATVFPIEMIRATGDLQGAGRCLGALADDNAWRWERNGIAFSDVKLGAVIGQIARLEI